MLVAPAVACEISEPPRMPRGTSCSGPGLTSFMPGLPGGRSGDGEIVVQPLRAPGADPVVERLRAGVVERRLPRQTDGAVRAAALGAGATQPPPPPPPARPARRRRDEEVVHHADPRRAGRRPRPEDGREAERPAF